MGLRGSAKSLLIIRDCLRAVRGFTTLSLFLEQGGCKYLFGEGGTVSFFLFYMRSFQYAPSHTHPVFLVQRLCNFDSNAFDKNKERNKC